MSADPVWRLSGGGSNTDPNASLGGVISSTAAGSDIFDKVTGDEHAAGDTEYRGIYVYNNGDVDLENAVVWFTANTPSTDTVVSAAVAAEGVGVTMATIANESTAPAGGLTFSSPSSKGSGISIGTIPASSRRGVWLKRVVTAGSTPEDADTFTLRVEGDTAE